MHSRHDIRLEAYVHGWTMLGLSEYKHYLGGAKEREVLALKGKA